MKKAIIVILLFVSIPSVAQVDYKRQLDSLIIVHKVCTLENQIRNQRVKLDQIKKKKQSLNLQLQDIQSFRLGRTDSEKEIQLSEINLLIETNSSELTAAGVQLTTLINELVLANDDVKALKVE